MMKERNRNMALQVSSSAFRSKPRSRYMENSSFMMQLEGLLDLTIVSDTLESPHPCDVYLHLLPVGLRTLCINVAVPPKASRRITFTTRLYKTLKDIGKLQGLIRMDLEGCSLGGEAFATMVASLPDLKDLRIQRCVYSRFVMNLSCPRLEKLAIIDDYVKTIVLQCPILTELSVESDGVLNIKGCPLLRHCDMNVHDVVGAETLTHVLFAYWDWENLTSLRRMLPNVVDLTLTEADVGDSVFEIAGFPHLQILRLQDVEMQLRLVKCPNLTTITETKDSGETRTAHRSVDGTWSEDLESLTTL